MTESHLGSRQFGLGSRHGKNLMNMFEQLDKTVQVYSPTGALRGDAVIGVVVQRVRFLFMWRSGYLEFSSWPKGTRWGDLVIAERTFNTVIT